MTIDGRQIQSNLEELLRRHGNPGAALEIRERSASSLFLEFSNIKRDASFPIYSVAKPILAILALHLVHRGVLQLDGEIGSLIERKTPEWLKRVSLRNLLRHRSGLADYGSFKEYHEAVRRSPSQVTGREEFVVRVFDLGPQFQEGRKFNYSNIGYMLIKEIIESQSKSSLQKVFDEAIGGPLGIKMIELTGPSKEITSGYSPYLSNDDPDVKGLYDFNWVFHGTFHATLTDLTKLFENLETLVGGELFKEMTTLIPVGFPHPEINASYGLGLMGDMNSKFGPLYGHNGGGPGFSIAVYAAPKKKVTVAAVVNRDSSVEAEKLVTETLKMISQA